jgi:hypothetical protein
MEETKVALHCSMWSKAATLFGIYIAVEPERRTYAKGFASSVFELCILNVLRAEDTTQ